MTSALPEGMSQPAHRALAGAGIETLEDAAHFSEQELSALHGLGPKAVRILREALHEHDMNFVAKGTSGS